MNILTLNNLAEHALEAALRSWKQQKDFQFAFLFGPNGVVEIGLDIDLGSDEQVAQAQAKIIVAAEKSESTGLVVACTSLLWDRQTGRQTVGIFLSVLNRGIYPYEYTRTFVRTRGNKLIEAERVDFAVDQVTVDLWTAEA